METGTFSEHGVVQRCDGVGSVGVLFAGDHGLMFAFKFGGERSVVERGGARYLDLLLRNLRGDVYVLLAFVLIDDLHKLVKVRTLVDC